MKNKNKKPLTKIEIEKKKDKSILWCKIITAISLFISLLSLLFSCSANVSNNTAQTNTNDNISVLNRKNAIEGDTFIYSGDYGYFLRTDLSIEQLLDFMSYIDTYLGVNKDKSITFIFDSEQTTSIYNVVGVESYDSNQIDVIYSYNDEGNIVYPVVGFSPSYYLEGSINIILKFNNFYRFSDILSQYFSKLVNIYNYSHDTDLFYYIDYELGLLGSYALESSYNKQNLSLVGDVYYYDSNLNYISFSFYSCVIDYDNGLQFFNDNETLQLYTGLQGVNKRSYTLRYYDELANQLVKVSNIVLSQYSLESLPSYFVPLNVRYQQTYNLANMYYSQRRYVSSVSATRVYNFNYRSNNQSFSQFRMKYTYNQAPLFYWNYMISYGNDDDYTLVLDVDATPRVNGVVGNASGVDYTFNFKIESYQTFTIYDFFDTDIQYFQVKEGYPLTLNNDSSGIGGNGDLNTALDVVVGVFTAFLPFLSYEIFPNITIGVLILIPFFITLMLFIFKLFKR